MEDEQILKDNNKWIVIFLWILIKVNHFSKLAVFPQKTVSTRTMLLATDPYLFDQNLSQDRHLNKIC